MQSKLNPQTSAKINFPGFQEILDFTSAGSESSTSVTVDGDTDKEYKIICRNLSTTSIHVRLNNDSGNNYGFQYLDNTSGSISAARSTANNYGGYLYSNGLTEMSVLTPSSCIKTMFVSNGVWSSGTTINEYLTWGFSWNSTSNVTSINFVPITGNFTSGTRITVYARRSQS
jgi:hypothetical protein